ncbi:hypothetical protein MPSEU_000154500 [Mayamaea pseudoterrestris]|nr:hypothetical protein MPSEU_000154500 [Mayamaea pseudoterrestris]
MKYFSNTSSSRRSSEEDGSASFVEGMADMERAPKDDQPKTDGSASTDSFFSRTQNIPAVSTLILFLGIVTSAAFLSMGIKSAQTVQAEQFERSAFDLTKKMQVAWDDYENAAAVIHMRCRGRNFTRRDFRDLYEYLTDGGLRFKAAQFDPNITDAERPAVEEEARQFYAQYYPTVDYQGIRGFVTANATTITVMPKRDFYFPIHYMEPVEGNERAIDLDYHASGSRRATVIYCMNNGMPALTDRLILVQETEDVSYGVVLMHPGYNLTQQTDIWPKDLASIVIRIPDLLERSAANQGEKYDVYLYDKSDSSGTPLFLGAASIKPQSNGTAQLTAINETKLEDLTKSKADFIQSEIEAGNKIWGVVIVKQSGTYKPDILFIVIGGSVILCASVGLSIWVYYNMKRFARYNREKMEHEAERASLILASAEESARVERELNDFIAHEVRNPVAAAMAACSFVKAAVDKQPPLVDPAAQQCCREDISIIENALKFVNDLLRNMLDMHRASNKQMKVDLTPVDLLHDVFEPVQAMLTQRGSQVEISVDCPKNVWVMSDRLRLKQVIINLGRNSCKFVDRGFIRLAAELVDDNILLSVSDSGPGIPPEKRKMLFHKFQESLDMLSQGTGIGLFLCKNLVELLGGKLYLDETFESGVPGCPGTRFVVNLKQPPVSAEASEHFELAQEASINHMSMCHMDLVDEETGGAGKELPEKFRVLFVDDDPILRKLFARTIRTVAPTWDIREVSNGETALQLTDTEQFDMIFMDMYMASVEKQLLGTETVEIMRSRGVTSRICGLSANDKEKEFIDAGANAFTIKPFPCEPRALTKELLRILFDNSYSSKVHFTSSITFADPETNDCNHDQRKVVKVSDAAS